MKYFEMIFTGLSVNKKFVLFGLLLILICNSYFMGIFLNKPVILNYDYTYTDSTNKYSSQITFTDDVCKIDNSYFLYEVHDSDVSQFYVDLYEMPHTAKGQLHIENKFTILYNSKTYKNQSAINITIAYSIFEFAIVTCIGSMYILNYLGNKKKEKN